MISIFRNERPCVRCSGIMCHGMGTSSKSTTAIPIIFKWSLKRRILLASGALVISFIISTLMSRYDSHATGFGDLIIFIFVFLIIFRPRWIDRWNEKNREGTENSDPDLRRWM